MYTIYALVDPRDEMTYYVGMTNDVYARFPQHVYGSGSNHAKNNWLRDLRTLNLVPRVDILDTEETKDGARLRESYWIHYHLAMRSPLTNVQIPPPPPDAYEPITENRPAAMAVRVPLAHASHVLLFLSSSNSTLFKIHSQELHPSNDSLKIKMLIYSEEGWVVLLRWMTAAKVCGIVRSHKQSRYTQWMQAVQETNTRRAS